MTCILFKSTVKNELNLVDTDHNCRLLPPKTAGTEGSSFQKCH